jgi:hypothetical protein
MIYGSQEFNDVLIRVIRAEYRHPYYSTAKKLAEEMSVHVYGTKPEELLNRVSTRQLRANDKGSVWEGDQDCLKNIQP